MPMWAPPTPPQDDNDVFIDQTLVFLYDRTVTPESQLPPVYIRREHKRPKMEAITTRKQKQRKEEQPRVPRSLFDRPTAALLKMRREAKILKLRQGLIKPFPRPTTPAATSKPLGIEPTQDHPEWLIHEDWALLQAVQTLLELPLNLSVVSPAHIENWDLVSDVVNSCSRVYRSPKQCKNRYQNILIPREEGRILYDINPRKPKKSKGIYKTKNNRPMRTSQLYVQDGNKSLMMLYSMRFENVKSISSKRSPTMKQTLVNPSMKNPKHAAVLAESGIAYDQPLTPGQVASKRADRIQREKKQTQLANAEQQLAAQRGQPTTATTTTTTVPIVTTTITTAQVQQLQPLGTAASSTVLQTGTLKTAASQSLSAVTISRTVGGTGNIVVNTATPGINAFAAINKRMSQQHLGPTTVAVSGASLTQAIRAQRAPLTVQEITAAAQQAQVVATQGRSSVAPVITSNLTAAQLAQRISAANIAATTTVSGASIKATTVQQHLTQAKNLPQTQINVLRQQQMLLKQQQLQAQKLTLTPDQLRQQHIKRIQTPGIATGQKAIIAQQLVTSGAQQQKQVQLKQQAGRTATLTDAHVATLLKRQQHQFQQKAQQGQIHQVQVSQGQLTTAQIMAHVQQSVATSNTSVATLVKTVAAPGVTLPSGSLTIPINVSVPQQKVITGKAGSGSQLHQLKLQQMQLQGQRKPQLQQTQKVTTLGQAQVGAKTLAVGAVQIFTGGQKQVRLQHLQQYLKPQQVQVGSTQVQVGSAQVQVGSAQVHQVGSTIQQLMSQPTIIVSQAPSGGSQVVTKVSLGSVSPSTHIQAVSVAAPIHVTQTTIPSHTVQAPVATLTVQPQQQPPTTQSVVSQPQSMIVKATNIQPPESSGSPTVQMHTIQAAITQQQPAKISPMTQVVTQTLPVQQVQQAALPRQQLPPHVQQVQVPASPSSSPAPMLPQQPMTTQQAMVTTTTTMGQPGIVTVTSLSQLQQQAKSSPYGMRTRNQPKH